MSSESFLKGRKNNFDFIRLFLAVCVVGNHIITLTQEPSLQRYLIFIPSNIRVCSFFIISGLLVSKSFERRSSIKEYFIKRGKRILPAYIVCIILCAFLLFFVSGLSAKTYFLNRQWFQYTFYNLLFLNFLQPELPNVFVSNPTHAVNGALWNIKIEVGFYFVLPLLIYWLKYPKFRLFKLILLYAVSILYRITFEHIFEITGNETWLFLSYQLPGFLCYFICGVAIFLYQDRIKSISHILFIVSVFVLFFEIYEDITILRPISLAIVVMYFASRFKFLNNFGKYGDFSYGIYIFHYPIIQLIILTGWFQRGYSPIITATTSLLLIVIVGILSWFMIEKRFLKKS